MCGHDLLTSAGRRGVRRDVGVLFQNPENQIVGEHVEEDLAFGLENLGLPSAEIAARVDEVLAQFGLEELRHREPHLLSGGQKQRVALAGVLAIPRRVLVLDEPTAMLDPAGRDEILAAVGEAHRGGLTIVYVTQEMDEVLGAGTVVALEGGAAVFAGIAARAVRRRRPRAAPLARPARRRRGGAGLAGARCLAGRRAPAAVARRARAAVLGGEAGGRRVRLDVPRELTFAYDEGGAPLTAIDDVELHR